MGFSLLLNLATLVLFPLVTGSILRSLASRPNVAPRWVINSGRALIWVWLGLFATTFIPFNYQGAFASIAVSRTLDWALTVLGVLVLVGGLLWGIGRFLAERLRLGEIIGPECWDPTLAIRAGGTWKEAENLRRELETQYQTETKIPDLGVRYSKVAQLPFTVRNRIFAPLWVATSDRREFVAVLLHHEREHIILGHHKLAWRYGRLAKILPPLAYLFAPMKLAMEAEADRRALAKINETSPKEAEKYIQALRSVVEGAFEEEQKLELGHDAGNVPARIVQATTAPKAPWLMAGVVLLLALGLGCARVFAGPVNLSEAFGFTLLSPPKHYAYRYWHPEAGVKPLLGQGGQLVDGVFGTTEGAPGGTLALSIMPSVDDAAPWKANLDAPAMKVVFDYEARPIAGSGYPSPSVEVESIEATEVSRREDQLRSIDFRFIHLNEGKGTAEFYILDQDGPLKPKISLVYNTMYVRVPAGWHFKLTNLHIQRGAGPKDLRTGRVEDDIKECVQWKQSIRIQEPPPNLSWNRTTVGVLQ